MPFLDHLEELRSRLLKAVGAVAAASVFGIWSVQRFDLLVHLKRPIEQYLPDGKLSFTDPTEPVMIIFKLGLLFGLVLASPVLVYQIWAFLSPALYDRERRVLMPALGAGLVLFLGGSAAAWFFVVPQAIAVLFSFQGDALTPIITYEKYFGLVVQLVLTLGLAFELPLVLIILAALGLVTPAGLGRFRRVAIVLSTVAGALLSPGTDPISMLMLTVPFVLLYEVGVAGAALVHRRRLRSAATALLLLGAMIGAPASAAAQGKAPADTAARRRADTTATARPAPPGTPPRAAPETAERDTLRDARVGLPSGPTRRFAEEDSVMKALKARGGFTSVRFRGDSAQIDAERRQLRITGAGLTEREGATLEADSIAYDERACLLEAGGDPRLFQGTQALVGGGIRYDTCRKRGVVLDALTTFPAQGTTWFLRGNVAQDSSTTRIFAQDGDLTSCDLPVPHYSFRARKIKWLQDEVLVARPVVLYVRDVPLLWLPFVFQDLAKKGGRKSGILIPRVGLADLVRTSRTYQRQITNFGYYWAASDYYDVTVQGDWYAGRNVRLGTRVAYNVLDRFLQGSLSVDRIFLKGGGGSTQFVWTHNQRFSIASSLALNLNFATETSVLQANTVNARLAVQQIASSANYQKRFRWGSFNLGGNRRQSLSDGSGSQGFPQLTLSPNALNLGRTVTWAPGLRVSNDRTFNTPAAALLIARRDGGIDTVAQTANTRVTRFDLDTPLRFGRFQWTNAVSLVDRTTRARSTVLGREGVPGGTPADSVTVLRTQGGTFGSELDWSTSINLPIVFPNTWRIVPALGVQNATAGPLALRNERTQGQWVTQGKRFNASLSSTPTLYGFLPGLFPGIARIRHSVNPQVSFNYAPAASVPEAYARAITQPGQALQLRSNPQMTLSVSLLQSFEGKTQPAEGDSTGASARKVRLLSIQTSGLTYDFEQAKREGFSGWATGSVNNTFQSDLLPGFNMSTTHDLFRGAFSSDTASFAPFLSAVQANFSISNRTLDGLLAAVGLKEKPAGRGEFGVPNTAYQGRGLGQGFFNDGFGGGVGGLGGFGGGGGRFTRNQGFNASLNYALTRQRRIEGVLPAGPLSQSNLGFTTTFSPTPLWNVSWQGQYNVTLGRFEAQAVRLERDLHEWRASFSYQRVANGNSAFYLSVGLIDIPQLKLDYNRTSFER